MKTSWLENYISFTQGQESPQLFHYWCGLSVLASVIGRNIYLCKSYDPDAKLYPNLYVFLVAPSGKCRKGGALGMAYRIIKETGTKVYAEAITKRALTQTLADEVILVNKVPQGESKIVIWSEELECFLNKEAYAAGLFSLLTRLYDCPNKWEYTTATQGKDCLYNVCANIVGGTIPDWFRNLTTEVMRTGFLARIMIIAQTETPRREPGVRKNSKKLELLKKKQKELIEFLVRLKEVKKEVSLSNEAINLYESWYMDREGVTDERFASFYEREHDHLIKITILLAASYGDLFHSDVIGSERVKEALMVLEKVKSCMALAYMGIGEHIAAKGYERVLQQIRDAGGEAEHSLLLRKNWYHFDTESFKKVIDLLVDTNRIRVKITKSGKRVYVLVKERR